MPSFTFISTVALALLSATSSMAQTPPRGRPNRADLFGYPHNRGDHSGTRNPAPAVNKPMTPGGYVDPRPANDGAQCRPGRSETDNQCSTNVKNAIAVCTPAGKCSFRCLGNTKFDGKSCTGQIVSPRCSFDRQCPTTVANATGKCYSGRCSFQCDADFFASGSTCAPADKTCGNETCPSVPGGYSVCVDGKCSAKCEAHLGFSQYCSADKSVCQCVNTQTDPNNCGAPGNVCPPSYNGKGKAYCASGVCGLSCYRLTKVTPREGDAYCT